MYRSRDLRTSHPIVVKTGTPHISELTLIIYSPPMWPTICREILMCYMGDSIWCPCWNSQSYFIPNFGLPIFSLRLKNTILTEPFSCTVTWENYFKRRQVPPIKSSEGWTLKYATVTEDWATPRRVLSPSLLCAYAKMLCISVCLQRHSRHFTSPTPKEGSRELRAAGDSPRSIAELWFLTSKAICKMVSVHVDDMHWFAHHTGQEPVAPAERKAYVYAFIPWPWMPKYKLWVTLLNWTNLLS